MLTRLGHWLARRHGDYRLPDVALEPARRDKPPDDDLVVSGREQADQAGFSWESPRWRDPDAASEHVVERERRFHDAPAPGQRGAIDDDLTIGHEERSDPPGQTAGMDEAQSPDRSKDDVAEAPDRDLEADPAPASEPPAE